MPIPKQPKGPRFEVDRIFLSLRLLKALIPIKFKCRFFVQLKTYSATASLKTLGQSKDNYRTTNSIINFNGEQTIEFDSFLVFDNDINRYKKKEVQVIVNLISDNRGDQIKLVGRVRLDLNDFMIDNKGETLRKQFQLQNCSVKKPEIAKLQFQLKLLREEKTNLPSNPDKQNIYAEIEKGLFADALEYNQFTKEVFGKDAPVNKMNRSLNDSQRLNSSKKQIESEKTPTLKEIPKPVAEKEQNNQVLKTVPIAQYPINESTASFGSKKKIDTSGSQRKNNLAQSKLVSSVKKPLSHLQGPNGTGINAFENSMTEPLIESPSKVSSPKFGKVDIQRQSPSKRKITSPQSRKILPSSAEQMTEINPSTQNQEQRNFLTESMFDEQQLVIESLQEQLEEANQIIEQYKLELDLLKEETERLEEEKEAHHQSQMEGSRARAMSKEIAANGSALLEEKQQEIKLLSGQLQQYKKVFEEKQDIIKQKDSIISKLQTTINETTYQFEQRLFKKDQLYNDLHQQYLYLTQQESYAKTQLHEIKANLVKKQEDNEQLEGMIDQLKKEVESLGDLIKKNNNVADLTVKLADKEKRIKELEETLQFERTTIAETQLRNAGLQSTIQSLNMQAGELKGKLTKSQQNSKKYQETKDKAEQQMHKAVQKSKQIQKEKYLLNQQITQMNLNQKGIDKLVEQKVSAYRTQYEQLVLSYEEAQNKIAELKFAVQSYQSTLDYQQTAHQEQVDQLTKKLENFNKKEHLLRQSLDLLENETTKIRNFVEEKEIRIREYEELVGLKDQELHELRDKLHFLERKQRMAENAIEDLKLQLKMTKAMTAQSMEDGGAGHPILRGDQQDLHTRIFILTQTNMQLLQKQKFQAQIIDEKDQTIHQLQKAANTVESLKRELKSLEDKALMYEKKNIDLRDQLKGMTKSSLQQRSKAEQQISEMDHVYKQCEKFQEQVKSFEQEKIIMFNQFQQKELQNMHLTSQQEIQKETIKLLQKQLDQKEIELLDVNRQLEEIEKVSEDQQRKISMLESSSSVLSTSRKHQLLTNSRNDNHSIKQPISFIKEHDNQLQIDSSRINNRSKEEQEIYRLTEQLQGYKQREESYMCNVLDLQEQLQKVKKQKLSLSSSLNEQKNSIRKSHSVLVGITQHDKKDLKIACDQLQKLIEQRIKNRETENLIQMMVSNSQMFGGSESRMTNEEGTLLSRQKNSLQEKSRILSREVQKIKSLIFKKTELSYKDKTQIIQMLKPCQNITNELIKIVENFARQNQQENLSEA